MNKRNFTTSILRDAVIFDPDGTIIDRAHLWQGAAKGWDAWQKETKGGRGLPAPGVVPMALNGLYLPV